MKLPENFSTGNIENYSSTVKAARKVLKEFKRHYPKEIDMWKVRTGKTIYLFTSRQKMERKLKELEDYKYAPPGENLKL